MASMIRKTSAKHSGHPLGLDGERVSEIRLTDRAGC